MKIVRNGIAQRFALLCLVGLVFGTGCLSEARRKELNAQEERGKAINILDSLNPTEAFHLREVGHFNCKSEDVIASDPDPQEACRKSLRFDAAGIGGELLVINSETWIPCPQGLSSKCLRMEATAYVRKPQT